MKLKTLLIGLMALVISFQTFATTETKTLYYSTGEVKEVDEYVDGKSSKVTGYRKTGEAEWVKEFVNGKILKVVGYYNTGEVNQVDEYNLN